tara:strand:+ start:250 stop:564 length:315 start_codon:yes stop_codon:yes gene_type:complete
MNLENPKQEVRSESPTVRRIRAHLAKDHVGVWAAAKDEFVTNLLGGDDLGVVNLVARRYLEDHYILFLAEVCYQGCVIAKNKDRANEIRNFYHLPLYQKRPANQ